MHQPFFLRVKFFQKEIFKIEIEYFSGFQSPEVRKSPDFWVWFSICSQNYGRITKFFFFIFGIFCHFLHFLEKIHHFWKNWKNSTIFLCLLEAQQQTHFSLLTCAVAGCVQHWAIISCIHFVKAKALLIITRGLSHCALAIYIKKYLNAKEELWKLKYFTMQKL